MKGIVRRKAIDTQNDPYLLKVGPKGVAVCKKCGSVYRDKRWMKQSEVPASLESVNKTEVLCPACKKVRDRFAQGFVTIKGAFVDSHRDEIVHLIRNKEKRAEHINPLERIIEMKEAKGSIEISTTTDKFAQRIGRMLEKTYSGEVEYKWSDDVKLARVIWTRQ